MKKILLPGMLATLAFAACTNEEIVSQKTEAPEVDLSDRPVVGMVNLNLGSQTRANMGENFNTVTWDGSVDKIGARIIDTRTDSTECHAGLNYSVSDKFAWSNYRYDYDGSDWRTEALMVEGNYMFYAPYKADMGREALKMTFPVNQKVKDLVPFTFADDPSVDTKVEGNTSAIEHFYSGVDGHTFMVGHTFLDAKEDDGLFVSPNLTHLYAYPVITIVNEYTVTEGEGKDAVKVGKPITIDQITIESDKIYANYTIEQKKLVEALKESNYPSHDANNDGDYYDDGDHLADVTGTWITYGLRSGDYLKNAQTAVIAQYNDTEVENNEDDPDGKIVVDLDGNVTIENGEAVKLNVVMPAEEYSQNNFKVNVRVVAGTNEEGKPIYKKFNVNAAFEFVGDGLSESLLYAVSKQIPYEEYNVNAEDEAIAKSTKGTLATFKLSGELVDVDTPIIDPAGIKNNEQFYTWLDGITDNSTTKYEKVFEDEEEVQHPDAQRMGDFRLASDHKVVVDETFVAKVYEYLNSEKAGLYFVSDLSVKGGTADEALVIKGKKFKKFGKLTIKSGSNVTLDGVIVAELVVEDGATVNLSGSTTVLKIAEVKGDVVLDSATLTAASSTVTFKGAANLTNVTIKGAAVFEKTATISGGSFEKVEFKNGGSVSGTVKATGAATVSGGTLEAAAGWETVYLYGGSMKITDAGYRPTVVAGRMVNRNNRNVEEAGTLTAAADDLTLPSVSLKTTNSKLVVENNLTLTSLTWTKGSIENSAKLTSTLTVKSGNTYTHNANAEVVGAITNAGTVVNKGKIVVENNGGTIVVGEGGFTKTEVSGSGYVNNTALGYVKPTGTELVIYKYTGAFSNGAAWESLPENAKINTLYINGEWTVSADVKASADYDIVFQNYGSIHMGTATLDLSQAKSVTINADQSWTGLDKDVSVIKSKKLTINKVQNANPARVYTLEVVDIDMGDVDYYSDVLANGGTINLANDMNLTDAWTVAEGKTVKIDMRGKTLSASVTAIVNYGTLTLTDGTIKTTANSARGLRNYGNATVDCDILVDASNCIEHSGNGTLTIEGGKYETKLNDGSAVRMDTRDENNNPIDAAWKLYINGGEFVSPWTAIYMANNYYGLDPEGLAVIKNATITGGGTEGDVAVVAAKNIDIYKSCTLTKNIVEVENGEKFSSEVNDVTYSKTGKYTNVVLK